jgi:dienelactone hydrolase
MDMSVNSCRNLAQAGAGRQPCARLGLAPILAGVLLTLSVAVPTQAFAETLQQRITRLEPHFTVARPDASGRAPVVIMLHGCGGPRPFTEGMARVATEAGAAAILVDSFAPRRISRVAAIATVCTGAQLQGRERAGDLYAAIAWARTQSWADPERIVAMGWSHGGWTIMDALALRSGAEMARATRIDDLPAEPLEGLAGTLIVDPYASVGSYAGRRDWRLAPRSIAVLCGRDYIVGTPRGPLERQRARGAPIDIHFFEDATHAFEDEFAEDPRVRYNPAATQREYALLRNMIASLNAENSRAR